MPGPAPGQTCTACNHPGIVLLNKAINDGQSDYKVGGAFNLPRTTIQRHRTKLHPGVKPAAGGRGQNLAAATADDPPDDWPYEPGDPDTEPAQGEGTPRQQLEALVAQLRKQAKDDGDDMRPELARELRLALEALGKMGSSEPPPVVQVKDVVGLRELLYDMQRALQPFPDARKALAAVWHKHLEEDDPS
jgi:hypothetical protein